MPPTARGAPVVLVFEASRLKAAFCAVGSGALVYLIFASQVSATASDQSSLHSLVVWGFAALSGGCFVAALLRFAFLPRLVVDQHGVRCEGGLKSVTLTWNEVIRIRVYEIRGMSWLMVTSTRRRQGLFLQGWKLSAHEMNSRIIRFREGLGQLPTEEERASVIPEEESDQRNLIRRQGMIIVVVAAGMAFLSLSETRQVAVDDLPPGVDFQWAVAPTTWGMALAAVALATSIVGFTRWFWPVGKRANPPLLSTMSEWTVFTICMLPLLCAGWMLFAGLAHPV